MAYGFRELGESIGSAFSEPNRARALFEKEKMQDRLDLGLINRQKNGTINNGANAGEVLSDNKKTKIKGSLKNVSNEYDYINTQIKLYKQIGQDLFNQLPNPGSDKDFPDDLKVKIAKFNELEEELTVKLSALDKSFKKTAIGGKINEFINISENYSPEQWEKIDGLLRENVNKRFAPYERAIQNLSEAKEYLGANLNFDGINGIAPMKFAIQKSLADKTISTEELDAMFELDSGDLETISLDEDTTAQKRMTANFVLKLRGYDEALSLIEENTPLKISLKEGSVKEKLKSGAYGYDKAVAYYEELLENETDEDKKDIYKSKILKLNENLKASNKINLLDSLYRDAKSKFSFR